MTKQLVLWFCLFCLPLCSPFPALNGKGAKLLTTGTFLSPERQQQAAIHMKPLSREDEIRRKIVNLKKEGKIKGSPASVSSVTTPISAYEDKVKRKLGKRKSNLLGISVEDELDEIEEIQAELDSMDNIEMDVTVTTEGESSQVPRGRIGSNPEFQQQRQAEKFSPTSISSTTSSSSAYVRAKKPLIDPSLFEDNKEKKPDMSEDDLVVLVAKKLEEKRRLEAQDKQHATMSTPQGEATSISIPDSSNVAANASTRSSPMKQTTSGVGGSWIPPESVNATQDMYKPKSGSWGAFPRPRDISKAYGGGRRVGAGYSKEDEEASDLKTKELLKSYRIKVGIEAPLEKEHAAEIEEALQLGQLAMQRGVYATAVSALEKVTKYCSTNSKVGSKVFLELAMAYEAVGRTSEAYQVYKTLSNCRMEDVKYNARRLLYGLEAMEFMRDVSSDFSRNKIKNTFIDTTGLGNIAQNFDDVYETAYVDLNSGFYKRLTESVVRSNREARQILLKATGKGEVPRMKVVQALRSIARHFDEALEAELAEMNPVEPTAFMDGKPIMAIPSGTAGPGPNKLNMDEFVLASPEQMVTNLAGKWRLQLLADKNGDGVSFYNTTVATQMFSTDAMTFSASGRSGLVTVDESGEFSLDGSTRVLFRKTVQPSGGGGVLGGIFGGGKGATGFAGAVLRKQQIMIVDSSLLVTKGVRGKKGSSREKEHFGVWRRVVEMEP